MAAPRNQTPAIGSALWIYEERQYSQDLVSQELEDFGFSVRNELEWLNEHMTEIFAQNGQNNLDVFKTPGKLRGKTPRTTRKKAVEVRQPLGDIFATNAQLRPSPAQQSLKGTLQSTPRKFQVAEDAGNATPIRSPVVQSPALRGLFSSILGAGKENRDSPRRAFAVEEVQVQRATLASPVHIIQKSSSQDTVMDTQEDTQVFTQETMQSTQATESFRHSLRVSEERRETGDSFVSAKEAFGSKRASNDRVHEDVEVDAMDVDEEHPDAHSDARDIDSDARDIDSDDAESIHEPTTAMKLQPSKLPQQSSSPRQLRSSSGGYSISAETHEALDAANERAHAPEPKSFVGISHDAHVSSDPVSSDQVSEHASSDQVSEHASSDHDHQHDDTVVHHDVEEPMDVDEGVRSPSEGSSPVKPLVRKSSLTFASLPEREPWVAKKSMGNRVSRSSHVDPSVLRSSQFGRFTGGKSLGGAQNNTTHEDVMDVDVDADRDVPSLHREESETTKLHNAASTKSLKERLNMLNQRPEPPKQMSQNIMAPQTSQTTAQPHIPTSYQPSQPTPPAQSSQAVYPNLYPGGVDDEDEDDDWISPIRTTAPAPKPARSMFGKSFSADTRPPTSSEAVPPKSVLPNPEVAALESTTPTGTPVVSPAGKKYLDGPLSASKAKFYSALRAAKEKIIGSTATSAQVKLDAMADATRPKMQAHSSSDDVFSPKRNEKAGAFFSHLRSPSKESVKTIKSTKMAALSSSSPGKEGSRRTRSSSERERKEKDTREKEVKQQQRAEDRLREMREKEQSKAAALYQKSKVAAKTPLPVPQQQTNRLVPASAMRTPGPQTQQARPGTARLNTAPRQQDARQQDSDSADDMPPPPPPKSLLPTGPAQKLREPKRLVKAPSKDTLPKGKPQKIQVNLHRDRFGQAPAAKPAPAPKVAQPAPIPRPVFATPKPAPLPPSRLGHSRIASTVSKPAAPAARMRAPTLKAAEKPRPAPGPSQPRADLAAARPVSRMQTLQDATRINVPPVNPAKPPAKRPFQAENDETLYRPAKRPSQQARSIPVTPAHAQFAQGKIPFAEPAPAQQPAQPPVQLQNSEDIVLPDIVTDSEDEDSDNDFQAPDWANTPNLRDMLTQQQLMDPEQIFGPIAPLNMEQVFPNKERHKRFRDRTSSAYWANDQVTEEERRKEREARERLVRDGAWTYNPSPRPPPRA